MFDVGWGELIVLGGIGIAMIGRADLPRAARSAGTQVGRLVGLMQGARVRADRYAAQNELRQLQNELRLGLRELDAVRSEMAVAVSSQGVMGRNLGSAVSGANKLGNTPIVAASGASQMIVSTSSPLMDRSGIMPTRALPSDSVSQFEGTAIRPLAPRSQAIGAVAEEEWTKQGIAFKSRAEYGAGDATGSVLLSSLIQQSLIFDQHDRVVQEQEQVLQSKIEQKMQERTKT
jgi:sec-independent protein translocase protein TatB